MKQGIYKITNENYHQHFCELPTLSTGVIKNLLDSPARCWFNHPRLNPKYVEPEHERKFDAGSAIHDFVLEGGKNIEVITGFDDWRKKEAQSLADMAYGAGKIPLLQKQFDAIAPIGDAAIAAIRNCSELAITDLKADGDAELSYLWEESGVWFKTRPDWISADKKLIIDLKTVGQIDKPGKRSTADPDDFAKKAVDLGYDIQSALYRRGCQALQGFSPEFIFVVVEASSPYLCSVVSLSAEFQALGDDKVESAIALWQHCLKTGKWPGYPTDRIAWLETMPWNIAAWESKKFDILRMLEK